jgi:hypothetical protein
MDISGPVKVGVVEPSPQGEHELVQRHRGEMARLIH